MWKPAGDLLVELTYSRFPFSDHSCLLLLRDLDDFDLALHESPSNRLASTEAIRIKIRDVLKALDKYSKHSSSLLEY
jgi:hypothetical protein